MTQYKVLLGLFPAVLMTLPALSISTQSILNPMPENLPKCETPEDITYTVIPPASGLNYTINVFDISEPVAGHYHTHQTQDIMVLEGKLNVQLDDNDPMILESADQVQIPANVWHALEPVGGTVRYLSTYFFDAALHPTGLPFPEDVNFTRNS